MRAGGKSLSVPIEGVCDARFSRVREVFEEEFESNREVGAAIAFTLDGESVVDLWGGHVDPERTRPWQRDTIVNTYSTTKGMTAICAHQLIERGKLDVDAKVADYWPEFAQGGKESIPVRWLLSHRAGLPAIEKPLPTEALLDWKAMTEALAAQTPWWEPGSKHGYHPVTFGHLVGELIRRVSGRTVGEWFRENVSGPLDADFHIGLPEKDDVRVSNLIGSILAPKIKAEPGKPAPRIKGPMADFMRDMSDPTTMIGAAFNNPRQPRDLVNTREWRGAEIPAANGHGTARALSRIYGALAHGGEIDGVRLLETESIDRARAEQAAGPDATLGGLTVRYGLGFMLQSRLMPLSPTGEAFGHAGAGGSLGMADPTSGVGFGYVMNKMKPGLMGGKTAYETINAFYEAL
jgi:CubicO group peptidase (beta-lactamase class C family)